MFRNPNKLLIALLMLLVGIGPVGSVMASPHACAPDAGHSMVAEGMAHSELAHTGDHTAGTLFASQSSENCDGCDTSCCQGGLCKVGHCTGSALAFQNAMTLTFERLSSAASTLAVARPLAGLLTPPFRPPQA